MREKRRDEEMGPGNEETTKQQTKQQPTKQQTTYEIILTLPTAEKETRLTQTPMKKPDKKHLQVPKPKRKNKNKRQRENRDQEPTTKKRHIETELERESESEQQTAQDQVPTKSRNTTKPMEKNMPNKTVTVQTKEGQYEATLTADNDKNCPLREIHEKLGLTRYRIAKPPMMMHNIARYYATKNLMGRQVLKFDIRKPDPHQQLWNRREEERRGEHHIQECIIETTNEIAKRDNEMTLKGGRKRNNAREAEQEQEQKRRKLDTTSELDAL